MNDRENETPGGRCPASQNGKRNLTAPILPQLGETCKPHVTMCERCGRLETQHPDLAAMILDATARLLCTPCFSRCTRFVSRCARCGARELVELAEREARVDVWGCFLCSGCFYTPLQTAAGSSLHWAACDSLAGLVGELARRGLIKADSREVWLAVRRVYVALAGADYMGDEDRAIMLGLGGEQ